MWKTVETAKIREKVMLKFEFVIELKEGYRRVMEVSEETKVGFIITAPNGVTVDRMIASMLAEQRLCKGTVEFTLSEAKHMPCRYVHYKVIQRGPIL